jgi:hypothetical protein
MSLAEYATLRENHSPKPVSWIKKLIDRVYLVKKDAAVSLSQPTEIVAEEESFITAEQQEKIDNITKAIQTNTTYEAQKLAPFAHELATMAVTERLPDESMVGNPEIWQQNFLRMKNDVARKAKELGCNPEELESENELGEVLGFSAELEMAHRFPVFVGMSKESAKNALKDGGTVKSIGKHIATTTDLYDLPRAKTYKTDVTTARANYVYGTFDLVSAGQYGDYILEFSQDSIRSNALVSTQDFNEVVGTQATFHRKPRDFDVSDLDFSTEPEDPIDKSLMKKSKEYYQQTMITVEQFCHLVVLYRRLSALSGRENLDPFRFASKSNGGVFSQCEVMVPYQFPESPVGVTSLRFHDNQRGALARELDTELPIELAPDQLTLEEKAHYISGNLVKSHAMP